MNSSFQKPIQIAIEAGEHKLALQLMDISTFGMPYHSHVQLVNSRARYRFLTIVVFSQAICCGVGAIRKDYGWVLLCCTFAFVMCILSMFIFGANQQKPLIKQQKEL